MTLLFVFSKADSACSSKCSGVDSVDSAVNSEIRINSEPHFLKNVASEKAPSSPLPWGPSPKPLALMENLPLHLSALDQLWAWAGCWISWAVSCSWSSKEQTACQRWSINAIACPGVWGFSKRNSQEEIQALAVILTTLSWYAVGGG